MSLFHTEGREDRFFKTEISKGSKVGVSGFVERCLACEADGGKGNRWSGLKSVGSL